MIRQANKIKYKISTIYNDLKRTIRLKNNRLLNYGNKQGGTETRRQGDKERHLQINFNKSS